jgi:hypothetical protein
MRTLSAALLAAQATNNRYPISKITVYDSLLRWSLLAGTSDVSIITAGDSSIPSAGFDADIHDGEIWLYSHDGDDTLSVDKYSGGVFTHGMTTQTSMGARPSAFEDTVFYVGSILEDPVNVMKGAQNTNLELASAQITATPYETEQWHAIAAVSSTAFYHAFLAPAGSSDSDYTVRLEYIANASDAPEEMDYSIPVDSDYSWESLSWFDAVRMADGTDVIVVNTETYGCPEIIVRRNGVWGNRFPMIPVDLVDNYSYLRIGWLTLYNGVIYATGELGRKGSTGLHPQSMAVVLRSADGVHWSMDRWRYLGQTPLRSPLLMDTQYAYLCRMPALYRAPLTPIFGLLDASATSDVNVFFEIEEDITQWSISMQGDREGGNMQLQVADVVRKYSNSASPYYLRPGYMLKVLAGYKSTASDDYAQIGWYGIDTISPIVGSATRDLSLGCREWNMRCLMDNAFDQDWQWLTQSQHYDDCDQRDYLYSIAGATVRLIDEGSQLETEQVAKAEDDGNLKLYGERNKSVLVSTEPFETRDGFAAVSFLVDGAYYAKQHAPQTEYNFIWKLGLNEYGLPYDLSRKQVGVGAGAAIIKDEHNFITSFLDVKSKQLILLRVCSSASSDSDLDQWELLQDDIVDNPEEWIELARHDMSSYINKVWIDGVFDSKLYETWIDVRGNTIMYGVTFSDTGHKIGHDPETQTDRLTAATIAAASYQPNVIDSREFEISNVPRNGENRLGIIVGTGSPYVRVAFHPTGDEVQVDGRHGRSLFDYNNGEDIMVTDAEAHQPYYLETSEYTWESFRDIQLGRSGWAYIESNPLARLLLHSVSVLGGSQIPTTIRGDYVTGPWAITSTEAGINPYEIGIIMDKDECYPPGEDGSYWLSKLFTGVDSYQHSGFWFMDGDLKGNWLPIQSLSEGEGFGDLLFFLKTSDVSGEIAPAVGDHVIYSPGVTATVQAEKYASGASRIYWNNAPVGVTLRSFIASDLEQEKSIQWTLDDMISKAGVLSTLGGGSTGAKEYSVSESFNGDVVNLLDGVYKDFDFRIQLSEPIGVGYGLYVHFGGDPTFASSASDSADVATLSLSNDLEAEEFLLSLTSKSDNLTAMHLERALGTSLANVLNFRVVKREEFIALWAEERLIMAYPLYQRWKDSAFSDALVEYGIVAFSAGQPTSTYTVKQEQLWMPIDGVIGSQGTSAVQNLGQIIRDARIKIIPDETLALRVSLFDTRDDAGQVPDVILNDQQALTDNVPTHIRVTGAEIGEYFDHVSAAEFGIRFLARTVESLAEEEAYTEAQRAINDFVGESHGRREHIAAQLQYEPEDEVDVVFESLDGQSVQQTCIISSIQLTYGRAMLEMSVTLREKHGS